MQFKSQNLVQLALSALANSGLPPTRLELEITESVLLQNEASTRSILHQLRTLGIRIAMDDDAPCRKRKCEVFSTSICALLQPPEQFGPTG
jgi:predicted signal transduction protein with EAL and GGDEF domain